MSPATTTAAATTLRAPMVTPGRTVTPPVRQSSSMLMGAAYSLSLAHPRVHGIRGRDDAATRIGEHMVAGTHHDAVQDTDAGADEKAFAHDRTIAEVQGQGRHADRLRMVAGADGAPSLVQERGACSVSSGGTLTTSRNIHTASPFPTNAMERLNFTSDGSDPRPACAGSRPSPGARAQRGCAAASNPPFSSANVRIKNCVSAIATRKRGRSERSNRGLQRLVSPQTPGVAACEGGKPAGPPGDLSRKFPC